MLILIFRAVFLYIFVIIVMRMMGKREIGQLQPYELAITLIISELVTLPMENTGIPLVSGIIPVLVITFTQMLLSFITTKSQFMQDLISGTYTIIIENGNLIEKNMLKQKYTIVELLEQLRLNGVSKISDVQYAILETSGQLSVILKEPKRPVTAEQMNINTSYEGLPISLILDGKLVTRNIDNIKITEKEVKEYLKTNELKLEDVFYLSVDAQKEYYLQRREKEQWRTLLLEYL